GEVRGGSGRAAAPANDVRPLAIVARQEWDAHPPSYQGPPQVIRRIVVHHDGVHYDGPVPGSEKMRRLLQSVQRLNGWRDVPYHFVIDVDGRVYEGRAESWPGDTKTGYDPSGLHIALQGDFSEQQPTAAQLDSLAQLVALKAGQFHVEPTELYLHRELAETQCPGAGAIPAPGAAARPRGAMARRALSDRDESLRRVPGARLPLQHGIRVHRTEAKRVEVIGDEVNREVQMRNRHGGVPRVADAADELARVDAVAHPHPRRQLLEMGVVIQPPSTAHDPDP